MSVYCPQNIGVYAGCIPANKIVYRRPCTGIDPAGMTDSDRDRANMLVRHRASCIVDYSGSQGTQEEKRMEE